MPGAGNPQAWNRYSYTLNSPINFNDPTGHDPQCTLVLDGQCAVMSNGNSIASTLLPTNPVGSGGNNNSDGSGSGGTTPLGGNIPNDCWGEHPCISDGSILPPTATFHPLQGNVVSQVPIYENNYNPPKLVGYRITSYAYDDVHVNLLSFLPIPKDSISSASLVYSIGEKIFKPGLENLASVGIDFACPECAIGLKVVFFLHDVNDAVTFDGHLRTHDVYLYVPYFNFATTPFDEFPYNLGIRR